MTNYLPLHSPYVDLWMCKTCGALVSVSRYFSVQRHDEWHKKIDEQMRVALMERDVADHWVAYGERWGYICSCPVGQDHEQPKALEENE